MVTRKIDDIGRITIPKAIREELGALTGAEFEVELHDKIIYLKPHKDKETLEVYIKDGSIYDANTDEKIGKAF